MRPLPPPVFMRKRIAVATANHFGVSLEEMVSPDRCKKIYYPRAIAMLLMKERTKQSTNNIAKYFNRDHTTAMVALARIFDRFEEKPELFRHYEQISRVLDGKISPAVSDVGERHVVQQSEQNGKGTGSDAGIQALEADGGPYAECSAPTKVRRQKLYLSPFG